MVKKKQENIFERYTKRLSNAQKGLILMFISTVAIIEVANFIAGIKIPSIQIGVIVGVLSYLGNVGS